MCCCCWFSCDLTFGLTTSFELSVCYAIENFWKRTENDWYDFIGSIVIEPNVIAGVWWFFAKNFLFFFDLLISLILRSGHNQLEFYCVAQIRWAQFHLSNLVMIEWIEDSIQFILLLFFWCSGASSWKPVGVERTFHLFLAANNKQINLCFKTLNCIALDVPRVCFLWRGKNEKLEKFFDCELGLQ